MAQPMPGGPAPAMDQLIADRIARSPLSPRPPAQPPFDNAPEQGVFIANPSPTINVTKIGRPGPGGSSIRPMIMPVDGNSLRTSPSDKQVKSLALGLDKQAPSRDQVIKAYLGWGAGRGERAPFYGYCDGFACVTIAILAARNSPLPRGCPVEWYGMLEGGRTATGHAITVVNRDPAGDPAQLATWGNGCLVVDPWYALQAGGHVARYVNGSNADAGYVAWLTAPGNSLRHMCAFDAGAYSWLTVRPL
ncbi:MAG: hypothetical protein JWO67_5268 [Streptosporangiaceae bacterium]|nr:hypothetical protein [Streptosporangiaceae bacterium]